jgi:SAM-dependent methyltransferase
MSAQSAKLLAGVKDVDGYMEIGTTGRYVYGIKRDVTVKGDIYLLHTQRPQFFSFTDIAERGQLCRIGKFVDMGDYNKIAASDVPDESLDLVSNFIGFHHAPPEHRAGFIASVARKLRPGGRLILRDHDVDSDNMSYIVALAHDVFNAGLDVPWQTDLHEVRNFASVAQIEEALHAAGMTRTGDKLLQDGDPTRNTLMLFVKA